MFLALIVSVRLSALPSLDDIAAAIGVDTSSTALTSGGRGAAEGQSQNRLQWLWRWMHQEEHSTPFAYSGGNACTNGKKRVLIGIYTDTSEEERVRRDSWRILLRMGNAREKSIEEEARGMLGLRTHTMLKCGLNFFFILRRDPRPGKEGTIPQSPWGDLGLAAGSGTGGTQTAGISPEFDPVKHQTELAPADELGVITVALSKDVDDLDRKAGKVVPSSSNLRGSSPDSAGARQRLQRQLRADTRTEAWFQHALSYFPEAEFIGKMASDTKINPYALEREILRGSTKPKEVEYFGAGTSTSTSGALYAVSRHLAHDAFVKLNEGRTAAMGADAHAQAHEEPEEHEDHEAHEDIVTSRLLHRALTSVEAEAEAKSKSENGPKAAVFAVSSSPAAKSKSVVFPARVFRADEGTTASESFLQKTPRVVWTFWFGKPMAGKRLAAFESLRKNLLASASSAAGAGSELRLITQENLPRYNLTAAPLHPLASRSVEAMRQHKTRILSQNHLVDYLKVYFMHHFGGGVHEIKPVEASYSWKSVWDEFGRARTAAEVDPDVLALGVGGAAPIVAGSVVSAASETPSEQSEEPSGDRETETQSRQRRHEGHHETWLYGVKTPDASQLQQRNQQPQKTQTQTPEAQAPETVGCEEAYVPSCELDGALYKRLMHQHLPLAPHGYGDSKTTGAEGDLDAADVQRYKTFALLDPSAATPSRGLLTREDCCLRVREKHDAGRLVTNSGGYVMRPGTLFTGLWLSFVETRLSEKGKRAVAHPAPSDRCCKTEDEKVFPVPAAAKEKGDSKKEAARKKRDPLARARAWLERYPFDWDELGKNAFHPLQAHFFSHVRRGLPDAAALPTSAAGSLPTFADPGESEADTEKTNTILEGAKAHKGA